MVYACCLGIFQSHQQQVIDRFLEFSEVVRGSCLHLLRCHDDPAILQGFQKHLSNPFKKSDHIAANGFERRLGSKRLDPVTFRLIEGGICFPSRRPSVSSDKHSSKDPPTNGSAEDIRCDSSGANEEECGVFGHTESFLQMAHAELSCSGNSSGARNADGNATALRIQNRTVIMAGSLIPLALDDTVVIEQKVSLDPEHYPPNDHMANGKHKADEQANRFEMLRDILHSYAYQGLLRLGTAGYSGVGLHGSRLVICWRYNSLGEFVECSGNHLT